MSRLKETLSKLAKEYQEKIQRQIAIEKLKSSGNLKDSIKSELTEDGFSITSDAINAYLLGDKGYDYKNGGKDESKIDRIERWARNKGLRPSSTVKSTGMRSFSKIKNARRQYRDMAYMISRSMNRKGSIKRYGYKGSDIIDRVYDMQKKKTIEEITLAFKQDIVDGIKADFKFDNLKIE